LFTVYGYNEEGYKNTLDMPHLILENITLAGHRTNTSPLVVVGGSDVAYYPKLGALTMRAGGRITGNTNNSYSGGGVIVRASCEFTMSGGSIDSNRAKAVAGVGVFGGAFTMKGGDIANNIAASGIGGGVFVDAFGRFTMEGGTIRGNSASDGAAVYIDYDGTAFSKTGGVIFGTGTDAGANKGTHAIVMDITGLRNNWWWRDTTANESVCLSSDNEANWETE
jgi:hypothetical protein